MKTYEDYKSYYDDANREQILKDTYVDYQGYKNLTREYSKLRIKLDEIKQFAKDVTNYPHTNINQCKDMQHIIEIIESQV